MRVVQPLIAMILVAVFGIANSANGQSLLESRSFAGVGTLSGGHTFGFSQQLLVVQSSFSPGVAQFAFTPLGEAPHLVTYSSLEFPFFPVGFGVTVSLLQRSASDGASAKLPTLLLLVATVGTDGVSVVGFGSAYGTDAIDPFIYNVFLLMGEASSPPR